MVSILLALLVAAPAAWAQCNVAGQWQQNATGVGVSTWTLTPQGGNRYAAQESGMGNATGIATMTGNMLRIQWRTGGFSGVYEWAIDGSCTTGQGRLVFATGRRGTHASAARRVGAAPGGQQASGYWARWVKVAGAGGAWSTQWTWYEAQYRVTYGRPVCGHGAACSCPGQPNYCRAYPAGSQAPFWAQGCNRPPWTVRCEVREQ